MTLADLLTLNWQKQIIPKKWLRFLYRSEILNSTKEYSLPFECDFYGMRYRGDIANAIDFHCFFYGAFEKGHLFFWKNVAETLYNKKGIFLDIGANTGHHSLFMSAISSFVHAFEPYELVRNKIIEKIQLNNISNIIIHDIGIGDKDAILPFYAPKGSNLGLGSFVANQENREEIGEPLRIVAGDEYILSKVTGDIHMIKIDVEAFEKHVIRGLNKTLNKHRPVVVFELEIGLDCSFTSNKEIKENFPDNYQFFIFDIWEKNGKKNKRKEGKMRKKGIYKLVNFNFDMLKEQTDVIAFPDELFQKFKNIMGW